MVLFMICKYRPELYDVLGGFYERALAIQRAQEEMEGIIKRTVFVSRILNYAFRESIKANFTTSRILNSILWKFSA
ncbi:MAG TPA: hypothetical protein DCX32_03950 [Candidatus Moranbacteria bacterium]|nr:hypothetical protein [Candidatus Moranbacteria bacterium]